jgi:1-aminocyclopropane-1-carboxylate deaminase/D-cysteine desulfhydrase-like pyridoxal-dependent ACC family enzyme
MAATLDRARESDPAESLLFLHTGGTPALFAYGSEILGSVDN